MYIPKFNAVTDHAILLSFIQAHPFGILISVNEGMPLASHIPFVILESQKDIRLGLHLAKANPHWKAVANAQVLAIFSGPHGHVSGSWYAHPQRDVPTWNYSTVHCTGRASLTGEAGTQRILEAMVREFEGAQGWSLSDTEPDYVQTMKRSIVGFEIAVTSIEGKFKYSQNRSEADLASVLEHLDTSAPELARHMRDYYALPVKAS